MNIIELIEELLTEVPAREPAKAWRNWFYVPGADLAYYCMTCRAMHIYPQDMIIGTCRVYPSRDIAESRAAQLITHPANHVAGTEYLGAFPDGERP